jgi:uncharacterized protein (TIGR03083 family)
MNLDTTRQVSEIPPLSRAHDASEVALAAYGRLIELLETLEPDDWRAPTACPGWDVAAMVGHLVGAGRSCASVRESVRQQLWGRRHADEFGGNALDATNALQVADHAALTPAERIDALRRIAPDAVRGRMRFPRPMRRVRVPLDQGGSTAPGMPSRLSVGHLMDVIYTRDVWLHTIDIARATSRPYDLDPAVDGRIVEDVVADWGRRHGRPFDLVLTGPGAVRFRQGERGGRLRLDAVEFCRVLSGRADVDGVEVEADPADAVRLLETRVLF